MGIVVNRTRLNPFPVKSASGEFISIDDAVNRPVKKLEISFTPQQDLHGESSPFPGGLTRNTWDFRHHNTVVTYNPNVGTVFNTNPTLTDIHTTQNADGSYTLKPSGTWERFSYLFPVVPGEHYRITGTLSGTGLRTSIGYLDENGAVIQVIVNNTSSSQTLARQFDPVNGYYVFICITSNATNALTVKQPMFVHLNESGETPSYVPYENYCPIHGYTGLNLTRTSINLLPPDDPNDPDANYISSGGGTTAVQYSDGNGYYTTNHRARKINVPNSGTYTISVYYTKRSEGTSAYGVFLYGYNADGSSISNRKYNKPTADSGKFTFTCTFTDKGYFSLTFYNTFYWQGIQVETGSVSDPYYQYDGLVIPVSWQTEAGEVFGGTLDLLTGVLTANIVIVTTNNDNVFRSSARQRNTHGTLFDVHVNVSPKHSLPIFEISNIFSAGVHSYLSVSSNQFYCVYQGGDNVDCMRICWGKPQGASTLEEFKTFLQNNPAQFAYEIETPITYQLSAHQVSTLMGSNRLWTDVGTISLDYRALRSAPLGNGLLGGMLGNPVPTEPEEPEEPAEETEE